jgi:putative transposase
LQVCTRADLGQLSEFRQEGKTSQRQSRPGFWVTSAGPGFFLAIMALSPMGRPCRQEQNAIIGGIQDSGPQHRRLPSFRRNQAPAWRRRYSLDGPCRPAENAAMPRTARGSVGGCCYHAINRGNGRARVFHDAADYHDFVRLLRQAGARVPMRLLGFCLVPNHFHAVRWQVGDDHMSAWMQWLLTAPVHGYRRRYRGSGHVWQGRFKAFPIAADEHLLTVLRYVERNPLRAGLVGRAADWPWSSPGVWLRPPLLAWLDAGPVPRPLGSLEYMQTPHTEAELAARRSSVERGVPYGDRD